MCRGDRQGDLFSPTFFRFSHLHATRRRFSETKLGRREKSCIQDQSKHLNCRQGIFRNKKGITV